MLLLSVSKLGDREELMTENIKGSPCQYQLRPPSLNLIITYTYPTSGITKHWVEYESSELEPALGQKSGDDFKCASCVQLRSDSQWSSPRNYYMRGSLQID
jgi:hypothetical protein